MNSGFFSGLFDFSFQSFITGKLIRSLYILSMIVGALFGFSVYNSVSLFLGVVGGLIGGVVTFFVIVVYARLGLELALVLFKIEENTRVPSSRGPQDRL